MITSYTAPMVGAALEKLKEIVSENESAGKNTVIFCEDRLTLAAERAVCAAAGGTFSACVYTFSRFLSAERGKRSDILSSQGSAMVIRKLIEDMRGELTMFRKLSSPTAAQDVYDTIALLYSSRVTPDDLSAVTAPSAVLEGKIRDLEKLYRAYAKYLEESGSMDRNRYLSMLPEVILKSRAIIGAEVIFLGFQAFTHSVSECASACMEAAKNVTGLFIGGREEVYVNEAAASFAYAAKAFGGCNSKTIKSPLGAEAERMRSYVFNPDAFHLKNSLPTDAVTIFEGRDEEDEVEYIASRIIKHVYEDGVRYQAVSVMLPDMAGYSPVVERVFSQYGIPYYLDKSYPLSEHPVCAFLEGYLNCARDGCTAQSLFSVVTSPLFVVEDEGKSLGEGERRKIKDLFVNYILRLAAYRGGIRRQPDENILSSLGLDVNAVNAVREPFLRSLKRIPSKGRGEQFCAALRAILRDFDAENILSSMSGSFAEEYPSLSALSQRAYESVLSVLDEAERLTFGQEMTVREFSAVLKSGFAATELSLIPPKQDAVFVSDLLSTNNIGSRIIFAAGLTGDVPATSQDTAVLTDRDLESLEALNIKISPRISQVNNRSRETAGLNLCAFRDRLYLTYPVRKGGEECGVSEAVLYARALFSTPSGEKLRPVTARMEHKNAQDLKYFCARPVPAINRLAGETSPAVRSSVYKLLEENGYGVQAAAALASSPDGVKVSDAGKLYGNSFTPTALESYFSCPYKCFMMRGLKLAEREEGVMRPLDCGNFIHSVLQNVFEPSVNGLEDAQAVENRAKEECQKLLSSPRYSALNADKRGQYSADALTEEAVEVCLGAFEQLKNSSFRVAEVEKNCRLALDGGATLFGRIDRVDDCGDMVRVIDYKTGSTDNSASSYYMGLKLQLPVYLLASSKGRRAVGAYYFPAKVEYEDAHDGVFRLKGYMDGSEDVVRSSDTVVEEKQKSSYVDAYLNGRQVESVLSREDFADFLLYSSLVARQGAAEMAQGYASPSPAEGACKHCQLSGSCGFAAGLDGEERKKAKVDCRTVAGIVRKQRGDEDGN